MNWSPYQQRIFDFIEKESGSAVIIAVAGSGKTTTIVECAKRIPVTAQSTFVAFNKHVQLELEKRLPSNVRAMTLNALGNQAWTKACQRRPELNASKTWKLIDEYFDKYTSRMYGKAINQLVALAKGIGLVPDRVKVGTVLAEDTEDNWLQLIENYQVWPEKGGKTEELIKMARTILRESIQCSDRVIDFNDQLYLPVIFNRQFLQNDFLFVDEAQDVNQIQREMLHRALKPGGRLIAVGDPCQAIYGFRGADTKAIENIKLEFDAIELPLTVSYRCPRNVITEAQQFVSHIEACETAPEGKVESLEAWGASTFTLADAVICRNNAPLVDLAFKLIRFGVRCAVKGRDIGTGLVNLVKKMKAASIADLERNLAEHLAKETEKLIREKKEHMLSSLEDKIATIEVFIENLTHGSNVDDLIASIERLFTDDGRGTLLLSSIHKAKGLEWPRVFILDPHLMPSKYATQDWQLEQETNLQYVAITRAKSELYYITSEAFEKQVPQPALTAPLTAEAVA